MIRLFYKPKLYRFTRDSIVGKLPYSDRIRYVKLGRDLYIKVEKLFWKVWASVDTSYPYRDHEMEEVL